MNAAIMIVHVQKMVIPNVTHSCLVEAAIEDSNRGSVVLINSYPGMLLSDSLEPDVSYTSILYCYYTILRAKIIHLGRKESEEQLLEDKLLTSAKDLQHCTDIVCSVYFWFEDEAAVSGITTNNT